MQCRCLPTGSSLSRYRPLAIQQAIVQTLNKAVLQSISTRDYPQVQASILVIALTYIFVNFASDLLYGIVDPRIKLE